MPPHKQLHLYAGPTRPRLPLHPLLQHPCTQRGVGSHLQRCQVQCEHSDVQGIIFQGHTHNLDNEYIHTESPIQREYNTHHQLVKLHWSIVEPVLSPVNTCPLHARAQGIQDGRTQVMRMIHPQIIIQTLLWQYYILATLRIIREHTYKHSIQCPGANPPGSPVATHTFKTLNSMCKNNSIVHLALAILPSSSWGLMNSSSVLDARNIHTRLQRYATESERLHYILATCTYDTCLGSNARRLLHT